MVSHHLLLTTALLVGGSASTTALSLNNVSMRTKTTTTFKRLVSPSSTSNQIGSIHEIACLGDAKWRTNNSRCVCFMVAAAEASHQNGEDSASTMHVDGEFIVKSRHGDQIGDMKNGQNANDFQLLVQAALETLVRSDLDGEELDHSYGSASQGLWMHAPTAKKLEQLLNRVGLKMPSNTIDSVFSFQQEANVQCLNWMKTAPSPLFLDLTPLMHDMATRNPHWVSEEHLTLNDTNLAQYISRVACHIIFLPSGSETSSFALVESTGAHIYGKLLYGGVTRYRLLKSGNTVRRVGEKREVGSPNNNHKHPSWVQLGGLQRKYEAIDMGPAAVLELTLLPKLWQELPTIFEKNALMGGAREDMTITCTECGWDPSMMQFLPEEEDQVVDSREDSIHAHTFDALEGIQRNDAIRAHFQSSVGGLQPQIDAIVRRVLDGRNICSMINGGTDEGFLNRSRLEAEELALLGLRPVRGVLLYGQPGVGKTMIAREIARLISRTPPKIVAASELLDRWVGGSERLVRDLFHDAEVEIKRLQETASVGEEDRAFLNSALHVIIVDEIDAVFRRRTDSNDSGSNSRDSVVNQMLAKLDGVNALPNILLIGMTNRRELLDPALLRPGRLEVQIEIPLPQQSQRREILQLHFGALRRRNRLSYPLRCAIDGVLSNANDIDSIEESTPSKSRKRRALRNAAKRLRNVVPTLAPSACDLAAETDGFSGADIAGLVRCAGSRALARTRQAGTGVESIILTLDDVKQAIDEVSAGRIRQR